MASKKILSNLDLDGNQLENVVVEVLESAPSNPKSGQIYYDSTKSKVGYYNGSSWKYVTEYTFDTTPTANSTNPVTSGGIKTAISTAETNAKNLANATGTLAISKGGTGATTAAAAEYNIIGRVETVDTAFGDDRYVAVRNQTVSNSNGSFRWFKVSNLWTYIKGKITGAISGLITSNLTASKALVSNSSGKIAASSVSSTELGYLSGVTSSIQDQLDSKQSNLTFDTTPTEDSTNPVTSDGIKTALDAKQDTITAGTGLSKSGTTINHSNSITARTSDLGSATAIPKIRYDAQGHITSAGTATVYPPTSAGTSGQVWQSKGSGVGQWCTLDTTPTANSTKPITSGAVKTALTEMDGKISAIPKFAISVVTELPATGNPATIYLVKTSETETGNLYTEYIYVNNAWEKLGTQTLDLSGYATTEAMNTALSGKVDKVSGKGLSTNDFTAAYKTKLDGIATGAEVNQNAFSNITVGSKTIVADAKTDTLTLAAGSNVTLTPDATNDKITIAATDTKYSTVSKTAAGLCPQLPNETTTTKYLRQDGSWQVPPDTKNTSGSTDTSSKIFLIGATSQAANPQTYSHDTAYVGTDGCLYSGGTKVLTAHQDISGKVNKSGDTMTGRLTTTKAINQIITGSGTAASDKGSGVSPRYFPAKWTFNTGSNATDGDIYTIKIPVAGHDYGVFMSVNNGTNYYPVILNGTSRLTTHFGNGTYISVIFEAAASAASMYELNGSDARVTVTGGCFRVINYCDYDTDVRPSAYCETAAGTAAKAASCTNYALLSNSYLHVLMRYSNTSKTALTFNVNGKGAKPIYINGSASSASNYSLPAGTYLVYYNGTNYYFRTDGKITGSITGSSDGSSSSVRSRGNVTAESGTTLPAISGISMQQAYNNSYPTNYGNVLTLKGTGSGQLLLGWSGTSGARANTYVRSKRDTSDANWSDWYVVMDSGNIGSYAADRTAITNITRSGTTFTATRADNTTFTFTQQDNNTTYSVVSKTAAGLCPTLPNETTTTKYLRQDGTWVVPPNTTYSTATQSANGLMSAADKKKLDGVATGAEVNQNAFSNFKVSDTTIAADTKTDTLTLVAGSNVTLTPDATNDQITISSTNTTYSNATQSAAGLMSAADKIKLDEIAEGAQVNTVTGVKGGSETDYRTGNVNITKSNIGLGNVANALQVYDKADVSSTNMNAVAGFRNAMGMASLTGTDTTVNPNGQTSWHHFINMSYKETSGSNMWQTQIANKAGTTDLWVRSRAGGAIADGTAWAAPWTRILTGSNWNKVVTKSALGIGNVTNYDQSKAIKSITRSGTTFTYTCLDNTTGTFTQQDNNTTYSANNGVGLSGTTFYNSGVRSIATGSTNGTISVNTNGTSADVAVKGLGSAAYTASTDYATVKSLTDENLNNVTTPGFYNAGGNNSVTNKPSGIDYFGLEVIHNASGSYYAQIINNGTTFYRRYCNNGTWSSWTQDKYTDTTYSTVSKTSSGLCPTLPNETTTTKYLRQDGTWVAPPNTTYSVVSKTAAGLCPKLPNETTTTKYLRQDGTWVVPPDNNTTYSAGAGLALSGTTFRVSIPRVGAQDSKTEPGLNTVKFEEYGNTAPNTPSAHWYNMITMQGGDANYCTQLALGMTTTAAYYRVKNANTWSDWKSLINTNTTYSAGAGLVLSGTTFKLRSCYAVDDSTNAATNKWHKFASCKITSTYIDVNIMFAVSRGISTQFGILTFRARVNGSKQYESNSAGFYWITKHPDLPLDDFVWRYTNESDGCSFELWVAGVQYQGYTFVVLNESNRNTDIKNIFTLHNTTAGVASYTTGTGGGTSKLGGEVLKVNGHTVEKDVPSNAVFTDTNTWRGIQDNLTSSTNTTESLSAKQGYLLANGSARDNTKLPLAGGTLTGALTLAGMDLRLGTNGSSSNDSGDISWHYGNGNEKCRIWTENNPTTAIGPNYRVYKSDGTALYTGRLATVGELPKVNNATLTIQKNGTNVKTFTANASSNVTANITVPTKVSELTNDSGYTTNVGTITGIKMNGASKGTSGVVDLGTVITAHQDISGKYNTSDLGLSTFKVTRGASISTATTGYWAAMCKSDSTGSPVLPTTGKWWHVISMDWSGNNVNSWVSQLAVATQDGNGVWWRRNTNGSTSIDSSDWNRLAEGDDSGNAKNALTVNGLTVQTAVPANAKFTDTTYSTVSKTAAGLCPALPNETTTTKYLRQDGTWVAPPNTWRGIQNNLTSSTNTTESLSAKQGYLLANGSARDNTKLPLTGGTIASDSFAPLIIRRNHTSNYAGIRFDHYSSGTTVETLGYLAINTRDGSFSRVLGSNTGTVYTILDSANSSVSLSGSTLTVKINGVEKSLTNTNTTYSTVSKTAAGLCPALPNETTTTKYLRQDGSWVVPPNTTYSTVSKTDAGLCPALPNETTTTKYLRQDGTWVVPPNTTYSVTSKTAAGLCPQLPNETTTTKYLRQDGTWIVPPNDNTKNTAGSTDTSSKIFLIGATSQAANPQTYSHDTAYVGTDGCLYSGGTKVLTAHQDISGKVSKSGDAMTGVLTNSYNATTYVNGLTNAALTLTGTNYDSWICGPTKNGNISISTHPGGGDSLYFGYGEKGRTDNSFAHSMTWGGADGKLTVERLKVSKSVNHLVSGSGTAASDKGSGVSPRYFPAKWTFNTGANATNGDIYTIKIPVAGHTYGVFMSVNNGTDYYPVVIGNGTSRITTHYPANTFIQVIFDSAGTANDMYALNGANTRSNISGGVFRVVNFYDSNTDIRPSAYCDTAAATAAKAASCTNYNLLSKSYLHVVMVYANTSKTALTFNVNGKGAKPIYINGSASSTSNYTLPAGTYLVYYNGTNYYFRTDGKITGDITGNAATVNGLTVQTAVPANAKFTDTTDLSSMTGTLPISKGGTGATTRLAALKALTNESVGSNATHFLTITTNWAKGGYTSVNDAKTVLGINDKANLASPAFTGTPTAPTAASGTNSTQIATTEFVQTTTGEFFAKSLGRPVLLSGGTLIKASGQNLWERSNAYVMTTDGTKIYVTVGGSCASQDIDIYRNPSKTDNTQYIWYNSALSGYTKFIDYDELITLDGTDHSTATQSTDGLMSASDKVKLDGIATGANKTIVDSELSSTSTNPVQNKVINSALAGKQDTLEVSQVNRSQSGVYSWQAIKVGRVVTVSGTGQNNATDTLPSAFKPAFVVYGGTQGTNNVTSINTNGVITFKGGNFTITYITAS